MYSRYYKKLIAVSAVTMIMLLNNCMAALPITSNLEFWLDASDMSSIVAADGSLSNGEKISGWNDILTGDNTTADNAVQSDPNNQPVWIESVTALNNNSAVMFDGRMDYLNSATLNIGPDATVFIVSQSAVQTHYTSAYHRPVLAADNSPWYSSSPGFFDGDGYGFYYSRSGVEEAGVQLADPVSGYLDGVSTSLEQDFSFNIQIFRRDGAQTDGTELYIRKVGDANAVLADMDIFFEDSVLHTGYDIGANPPEHNGHENRYYMGQIAEIIVYNTTLSESDMNLVSDYLYDKYHEPAVCGHPGLVYSDADINEDCSVDFLDFAIAAEGWLDVCADIGNVECDMYWKPGELAKQRWASWKGQWSGSFPIASWAYFQRYGGTEAEYQMYANANLTMVQAPIADYYIAESVGLKPFIGSWENLFLDQRKLDYYLDFPGMDEMLAGYMLDDEPNNNVLFEQIGDATEYIYANDENESLPIVNLLPDFGTSWTADFNDYGEYVDSYIALASPAVLSYDHYAILDDGSDRPSFYSNMELIRQKALENEIGFMGFALVTSIDNVYRTPSESDLNWQVYSLITYGAKGIFYWNYRIEDGASYGDGLVKHSDGSPSTTYPIAAGINAELIAMGDVLMSLESSAVYHTGSSVPVDTVQYSNGDVGVLSDFTGDDFVIGEFYNQDDISDDADYLMVMNKRHSASTTSAAEEATASITVNPTSLNVYKFNTGTGVWDLQSGSGGTYSFDIGGGKGILLKIDN